MFYKVLRESSLMRIVYDHQIFVEQEFGGISRYFCALAAELRRVPGVSTRIVAPLHVNRYLRDGGGEGVTGVFVPPFRGARRLAGAVSAMATPLLAAGAGADVVHETYYSAMPTVRSARRRVLTVFDMIHEQCPESFPAGTPIPDRKRRALERADHVLCISESTRRELLSLHPIPESRVTVTHLGFADEAVPTRSAAEIVGPAPYLLYVGWRPGYKNFLGLARAFAASPVLRDHLRIVCFGGGAPTGKEREALAALGLSDAKVTFVQGGDDRLASLYAGAVALVYPSTHEGFGIPPLEAMSLGCPVVCSAASSIPEVVGPAGQYFDPGSPESMAEAIEVVASSPARRGELIALGHARCRTFSWERCAQQTLEVYRAIQG